jgi:serine/alanine adding enzyme
MNARIAETKDYPRIKNYVERSPSTSLYHNLRWGIVIEKSFGHKYYCLICEEKNGFVQGILPLVHMKSLLFGNNVVSLPYFNYGGVCADDDTKENLLIEKAVEIASGLGANHMELRQEKPLGNGFPVKTSKVSMRLDLPQSGEDLWKFFSSKLRSQIRVPQKGGLTTRIGRLEELGSFYHVFSNNMRDLGTPVYPKRFFQNILEIFPESTWICSVYSGATPVASGFLAGWKKMLEIPWASSIRKYNKLSPNMLLYWTCLSFACERGYSIFDFGRSTLGESTYRFKEQWGAKPVQLHWHYWLRREGEMPEITPQNPKYKLAVQLWKKLPVMVTRVLGPHIIKNIP